MTADPRPQPDAAQGDNEIWSLPCECEHLFTDHWFDLTRPAGEPDTGCHECGCSGFRVAPLGAGPHRAAHVGSDA